MWVAAVCCDSVMNGLLSARPGCDVVYRPIGLDGADVVYRPTDNDIYVVTTSNGIITNMLCQLVMGIINNLL